MFCRINVSAVEHNLGHDFMIKKKKKCVAPHTPPVENQWHKELKRFDEQNAKAATQLTQIQALPEQPLKWLWHHYDCIAKVGEINHKQRQGSNGGKQELVSPP